MSSALQGGCQYPAVKMAARFGNPNCFYTESFFLNEFAQRPGSKLEIALVNLVPRSLKGFKKSMIDTKSALLSQ
jgi:hypothetical protein